MGLYKRGVDVSTRTPLVKENVSLQAKPVDISQKKEERVKSSLKTDIDKFYHIVEISGGSVEQTKILEILDVSSLQLEDWAKVLERQNLIEITYTARGDILYKLKDVLPKQKAQISSKVSFFPSFQKMDAARKKKIYLILGVVSLSFAIVILIYIFWAQIYSYASSLHDTFTDVTGWGI